MKGSRSYGEAFRRVCVPLSYYLRLEAALEEPERDEVSRWVDMPDTKGVLVSRMRWVMDDIEFSSMEILRNSASMPDARPIPVAASADEASLLFQVAREALERASELAEEDEGYQRHLDALADAMWADLQVARTAAIEAVDLAGGHLRAHGALTDRQFGTIYELCILGYQDYSGQDFRFETLPEPVHPTLERRLLMIRGLSQAIRDAAARWLAQARGELEADWGGEDDTWSGMTRGELLQAFSWALCDLVGTTYEQWIRWLAQGSGSGSRVDHVGLRLPRTGAALLASSRDCLEEPLGLGGAVLAPGLLLEEDIQWAVRLSDAMVRAAGQLELLAMRADPDSEVSVDAAYGRFRFLEALSEEILCPVEGGELLWRVQRAPQGYVEPEMPDPYEERARWDPQRLRRPTAESGEKE